MRLNKKILNQWAPLMLIITLLTACGGSSEGNGKYGPSMKPTFSITDKNPLGLYVAYHLIEMSFPDFNMAKNNKPFAGYFKKFTEYDYTRSKNIYAIISKQFYPNDEDVEAMTDYVSHGNTLFVVSNQFDHTFLEKFHLQTINATAWRIQNGYDVEMEQTGLNLTDSVSFDTSKYSFFFYPLDGMMKRQTSFPSQQIVRAHNQGPGAVVFKYGSGRIIAVTNATAFTNYFLLTNNNYKYLLQLLSYVPESATDITWDTYYNKVDGKRDGNFSSFQELMKHDALRWAFWLTIFGSLLLIIMALIRRQRMVPVVKPNVNSSIEFGETVARLYLLKKDNKNVATKMITYFLDQVRSKYYIGTGTLNHEFAQLLTAKSGVPLDKTQMLLRTIDQIQNEETISDYMLLDLNGQINQFVSGR
ncbi:MAG: DUF4350 domain-containing protein [Bacteroidota bacterium]